VRSLLQWVGGKKVGFKRLHTVLRYAMLCYATLRYAMLQIHHCLTCHQKKREIYP
jgi:hypothetical protein